jgi:hypothetical protein
LESRQIEIRSRKKWAWKIEVGNEVVVMKEYEALKRVVIRVALPSGSK